MRTLLVDICVAYSESVWQSYRALKILRCECILLIIKSMGADNISIYYAGDKASPFYTF